MRECGMSVTWWDRVRAWFAPPQDFSRELKRLQWNDEKIMRKLDKLGDQMSEATDLLNEINAETNDVSARIDALVTELENKSDASPEVLDGLRSVRDRLKVLGEDPENPVPPVEEPPADGGELPPAEDPNAGRQPI